MRGMARLLMIGWGASLTVLPASELEVAWPTEWTAFGPAVIERLSTYDKARDQGPPVAADLLPGDALKTIPAELMIGTNRFQARTVRLTSGGLDLTTLLPQAERTLQNARTVYLLAPVTATEDMTFQIGAGAYWWMQWWVDGSPVFNTLWGGGNTVQPTGRDYVFDVTLTRGEHVLAVAVISARQGDLSGFSVAVTGPQELRAWPLTFRHVMDTGRRKQRPIHWSTPIHYAAARSDFLRALALAATDEERAEARLAMGDTVLRDIWGASATQAADMRREYGAVLELPGARADQKAHAAMGLGEARLLENDGAGAREEFARALNLSDRPGWAHDVQWAMARASMQDQNQEAARRDLAGLLAMTNLDGRLHFDARLHLSALDVAPRIRPDHPRLFFNADTWPAVKAGVERRTNAWAKLRQEVEGLPDDVEVRDWGLEHWLQVDGAWKRYPDLMSAALVYRVTGNPALLAKVRRMLRAAVDHYLLLADNNASVVPRVNWLAALDWVWNDLPAAERAGLADDFLRYAYGWHVQSLMGGRADRDPYYYLFNMFWYAGLTVLGPELGPVARMRALAVLGRGYDNTVAASFGRRIEIMQDRGMVTRVGYAFNDLPTPAWAFMHCWRSAAGSIPAEWAFASGIAPSCVARNILGYDRGRYRDFGYGIAWRYKGGWQSGSLLYDNLGQFMYFFSRSQPDEAAMAAWLRQQMEEVGGGGTGHYVIEPYLLDLTGSPAPRLPEGLPLARHYPTNGLVLMSSGFDVSHSTYALFACGGGNLGEHFDAGHFAIFKRGYLALDSGTRAMGGASGANYDRQSVAHNTVLIRMPGEVFYWENKPLTANSGGQCNLPAVAKPVAFETGPFFAYAAADLTGTYHSNKCAQAVRQFLFLPPDHFVVFDRVTSRQADAPKTWLLHTGNEPIVTGKEFRADQEQGRLFCRTLLPADAVLDTVGGPGREFWADGQNWPIPENSPYLQQMGMANAADVPENVGRWRVEVKPGAARTGDVFLHLIQASDQQAGSLVESQVTHKNNTVALSFAVGPRAYAIRLNETGPVGGHIRIAEGGKTQVDKELANDLQRQQGVALEP